MHENFDGFSNSATYLAVRYLKEGMSQRIQSMKRRVPLHLPLLDSDVVNLRQTQFKCSKRLAFIVTVTYNNIRDYHNNKGAGIMKTIPTMTLPGVKQKPGRPATGNARTAAERKRDQRASDMTAILEGDDALWTETQCMLVLSTPSRFPKGSPLARAAWMRLGALRGFL